MKIKELIGWVLIVIAIILTSVPLFFGVALINIDLPATIMLSALLIIISAGFLGD